MRAVPIPYVPACRDSLAEFVNSLPCVIYESTRMLEIRNVSSNVAEFLGFEAHELVGSLFSLRAQVFAQDIEFFEEQLQLLDQRGAVSLIHRFRHRNGLPVRVAHRLCTLETGQEHLVRGCFLAVENDFHGLNCTSGVVDRFVHKLGNHLTLLQMIGNSLKRDFPVCREIDVLHETLGRTIELTRSFSDFSQPPTQTPKPVDMLEILDRALMRTKWVLRDKTIVLEEQVDRSLQRFSIVGDPWLLELAIGEILINAVEASTKNGKVVIAGEIYNETDGIATVAICVQDFGTGIEPKDLGRIFQPFFTTKDRHPGLGLNRARRFIEIHGGFLKLSSQSEKGTVVEINLPATQSETTGETISSPMISVNRRMA